MEEKEMRQTYELEKEWLEKYDLRSGRLKEQLTTECFEWAKSNNGRTDELAKLKVIMILNDTYEKIIYAHEHYLDWDIDEIKLQSIWDIATYFYKIFSTFPYKFINAMMSSGKSRLLNLTEAIAYKAAITVGMTDSALFRSANDSTLIFDEAETITNKDKKNQRIILNSGYKKGATVQVSKEKYVEKEKTFVIEKYPVYCPKMLANIWGMDDVLSSRCITSILEKSSNPAKVKLLEDFSDNPFFLAIKANLEEVSVVWCSVVTSIRAQEVWDSYITSKYTTTYTTPNYTKLHNITLTEEQLLLCNKIDEIGLDGRNLELYFPLLVIANMIGDEVLNDILRIAKKKTYEKKESELLENKDIAVIDFVSKCESKRAIDFTQILELVNEFKHFYENDEDNFDWINSRWLGRSLIRLGLISKKRRLGRGVEVMLNVSKAKEKIKMFKGDEEKKNE